MTPFQEALKEARERKRLTKAKVAEQMGWTAMYYARYENGYLLPSEANLEKFANFMGISQNALRKLIQLSQDTDSQH